LKTLEKIRHFQQH